MVVASSVKMPRTVASSASALACSLGSSFTTSGLAFAFSHLDISVLAQCFLFFSFLKICRVCIFIKLINIVL